MNELALLIAVAVWCGEPINSTKGAVGFKTGEEVSISSINKCRTKLLDCVKKKQDTTKCFEIEGRAE